ncbi:MULTISPECIES: antitoxin VapB family protein [Halobacterium]|uniref:antitoxin VapB family protein n=1 Tax=Halobacterium TaxID=2239 RepID=UPI00073F3EBD|nr:MULTISPECIES: antitoxin VapB family protein [Halobacterium]MCG1003104.1 antitoxin VapB family protein [Halobacterium noricense]
MGTKQVRVSERLYARVEAEKREGESFSEALERMVGGYGLLDFADDVEDASDAWDTGALEADFETDDEANRRALDEELP